MPPSRRQVVAALSGTAAVLAGCSAIAGSDTAEPTETPRYPTLREVPVYYGPTLPERPSSVRAVEEPTDAGIAVLGRNTSVPGERAVEWLRADVAVSVYGSPAAEHLSDLLNEGNVDEHFDTTVLAPGDPDQDLALVDPDLDEMDFNTGFVSTTSSDEWLVAVERGVAGLTG